MQYLPCAGLSGKHVPASEMARSAPGVRRAERQACYGETRSRPGNLEYDLDSGHVPTQRERRQVPQSHRGESHVDVERQRRLVVRHQVSNDLLSSRRLVLLVL